MSKKLDDYVGHVAHQLRDLPASVRDDEVRELRSHLEQLHDDFVSQGQTSEAATQIALEQFGEARATGIKMRDVWEGQVFGWKQVMAAFCCGLVPFLTYMSVSKGLALFQSWPESAFFTTSWSIPLPFTSGSQSIDLFFALLLISPVFSSFIHAFFLGRRAWMMSTTIYGCGLCWNAAAALRPQPSQFSQLADFPPLLLFALQIAIPAWCLFWGVLVAEVSARLLRRRRHHQLVLAAPDSMSALISSPRAKSSANHWRWKLILASLFVGVMAVGGFRVFNTIQERLDTARHPQTAIEAVRTKLLLSRDATKVELNGAVTVAERPPSDAELANGTRVVYFKSTYSLNLEYQKSYFSYLSSQLATASGRKKWGEKKLRDSLSKVSRNSFNFDGTAIAKKTSDGWQVDEKRVPWMSFGNEKTFDWSRLRNWLPDIPYED